MAMKWMSNGSNEIDDLTSIECSLQTIESLAFIDGYGVHKYEYMKRTQYVMFALIF